MKKILYILLVLPFAVFGQSTNQNYVKTRVYKEPVTYPDSEQYSDSYQKQEQVTYLDGLGRPIQQVTGKASPDGNDIITHMYYNTLGLQPQEYLPYKSGTSNLEYDSNAAGNVLGFYLNDYYENTTNPYNEKFFEASPLKRVNKQGAPGTPWKGIENSNNDHTVKFEYIANTEADAVRRFGVTYPTETAIFGSFTTIVEKFESTSLTYYGLYQKNELYKNIVKDENWTPADGVNKTTEEFKDLLGRIILKRNYNNGLKHDTYYVYDRFSNLTYVIPPLASDNIVKLNLVNPVSVGTAYPWVGIVNVDKQLADEYNRALMDYENSEILSVDLIDKYGGQGGFAITQNEAGNLTVNYNVSTTQPMELRTGEIIKLDQYGMFDDKEIGRLAGSGYEYYFLIKGNALHIEGRGKVPSLTTSFTGGNMLTYTKNYAWTSLYNADPQIAKNYDAAISGLDNSQILTTYTANPYSATGGIAVSLDEQDNLTLSANMDTAQGMELKNGAVITFDFKRRVTDRDMGTITGPGYNYTFTVKDNTLEVRGSGLITNISFTFIKGYTSPYSVNEQAVEGLCYIYHYDKRNRLIEKKIPGKQWEYMVYDKSDRVIAAGPALNPFGGTQEGWIYTIYEIHDRPGLTLWFPAVNPVFNTSRRLELQNDSSFGAVSPLYRGNISINNIPIHYMVKPDQLPANFQLLTANYYDTYDFPGFTAFPAATAAQPLILNKIKGQATGSFARILNSATGTNGITSYTGYDVKGRPIYSRSINNLFNSEDVVTSSLGFTGQLLGTIATRKRTGFPDLTVYDGYTYDSADRLLRHRQSQAPLTGWNMGSFAHIIADNEYDALGQLKRKSTGAKTNMAVTLPLQTMDYTYNIRGWLKGINDVNNLVKTTPDLFAFRLHYNNWFVSGSTPLYNGNIAETLWRSRTDDQMRAYSYKYDNLNRLTDALYVNLDATSENNRYDEKGITYDKNGNILTLTRRGLQQQSPTAQYDNIDVMNYTYPQYSNRLDQVKDTNRLVGFIDGNISGTDYTYDTNGNMVKDLNKGIGTASSNGITYNHLNLPTAVTFANGKNIQYLYDATGKKIEKKVNESATVYTTTQYDNGFVYEASNSIPANRLQFYAHPEGYVKVGPPVTNGSGPGAYNNFTYVYQYKDHLGNVRLSYSDADGNGIINNTEDFRDDFNTQKGWTDTNTPPVFSYEPVDGNYAGKIVNNTTIEKYLHSDYVMEINNSTATSYTYSVRVRGTVGAKADLYLFMKTASETGYFTQVDYRTHTVSNGTIWTTLTGMVNVPATIKKLNIRLDNNGGGTLWFDEVTLKRTSAPASEIVEEDNYYPFGLKHKGYNPNVRPDSNLAAQRFKYNGKELQDELGLGWYDYEARNYDPSLGRWMNIDPLAETSRRFSPYVYALNNPVYFIDPDGMEATAGLEDMDLGGDVEVSETSADGGIDPPKKGSGPTGFPPGSGLQGADKFVPSKQTVGLMDEANELLSNVLDYGVDMEASAWGAGASAKLGPLEGGIEASAASVSVSTNKQNALEVEVKGLSAEVHGRITDTKVKAGAEVVTGKVEVSKQGKITTSGQAAKINKPSYSKGSISLKDNSTIGMGVKVGPAKASVSANLYNLATGTGKLFQAGASYLSDYMSHFFD